MGGDPNLYREYRAYACRDYMDFADLFVLKDALFHKNMARLGRELYGSS